MSVTDDSPDSANNLAVPRDEIPNPETGVGTGAHQEPDTFEPEEDPD